MLSAQSADNSQSQDATDESAAVAFDGDTKEVACDSAATDSVLAKRMWLGPVPTGMDSGRLMKEVCVVLPGWVCVNEWEGGVEPGWWIALDRTGESSDAIPEGMTILGHEFHVRESVFQSSFY